MHTNAELGRLRAEIRDLGLDSLLGDILAISTDILTAWKKKDYGAVVEYLIEAANKADEKLPTLSHAARILAERYGSSIKPVTDDVSILIEGIVTYIYETSASISLSTLPAFEHLAAVKAKKHRATVKALRQEGFSKKEAMKILIAEISRPRRTLPQLSGISVGSGEETSRGIPRYGRF